MPEMVDFNWYESHKNTLHPLLLATAETQLKITLIQPFTTNNGKTARLCTEFALLQHGVTRK
jgi:Fic family protein